jgi:hypothetical protein
MIIEQWRGQGGCFSTRLRCGQILPRFLKKKKHLFFRFFVRFFRFFFQLCDCGSSWPAQIGLKYTVLSRTILMKLRISRRCGDDAMHRPPREMAQRLSDSKIGRQMSVSCFIGGRCRRRHHHPCRRQSTGNYLLRLFFSIIFIGWYSFVNSHALFADPPRHTKGRTQPTRPGLNAPPQKHPSRPEHRPRTGPAPTVPEPAQAQRSRPPRPSIQDPAGN